MLRRVAPQITRTVTRTVITAANHSSKKSAHFQLPDAGRLKCRFCGDARSGRGHGCRNWKDGRVDAWMDGLAAAAGAAAKSMPALFSQSLLPPIPPLARVDGESQHIPAARSGPCFPMTPPFRKSGRIWVPTLAAFRQAKTPHRQSPSPSGGQPHKNSRADGTDLNRAASFILSPSLTICKKNHIMMHNAYVYGGI